MTEEQEHPNGGPAFPCEIGGDFDVNYHQTGANHAQQYGMTLRDYFAAHASEDDIAEYRVYGGYGEGGGGVGREQARYAFADAMLKARAA